MFQQIRPGGRERHTHNRHRFEKWRAGAKIVVRFSGEQNTRISALMAFHANVLGKAGRQPRRVHNRRVGDLCEPAMFFVYVQSSRAVAILAADRHFRKRGIKVESVAIWDGTRSAGMARDTGIIDRAAEALIGFFKARR
jgi:hypothetical protein